MITVRIYDVMGQLCVEAEMTGSNGQALGKTSEWQADKSVTDLRSLCNQVTRALESLDSYAGDVLDAVADVG